MDVVIISNGLGNQMSQYAFYLSKKRLNNRTKFLFDKKSRNDHNGFELERVFNIEYRHTWVDNLLFFLFRLLGMKKYSFISRGIIFFLNLIQIRLVLENKNYDFNDNNLKSRFGLNFYSGGWHSEKYFEEIKIEILQTFLFPNIEDEITLELLRSIKLSNSVAVHVRRGDFMNDTNYITFGAVCTLEYFNEAIKMIRSMVDKPLFFVFSNDPNWVRKNIYGDDIILIDYNKNESSWKDMYLMSVCKHNVNSNSTFSWWSAYLNQNQEKKVIVPYYFINNLESKDFYPRDWIKLKLQNE